MNKLFEFDEHIGCWRVLVQTSDLNDKSVTKAKLGNDVRLWVTQLWQDAINSLSEAIASLRIYVQEHLSTLQSNLQALGHDVETIDERVTELEHRPSGGGGGSDNPHIIVLTQAEYDALTSYEKDVPYFIIPSPTLWRFGDKLPMILGGYGKVMGDPLPIMLN